MVCRDCQSKHTKKMWHSCLAMLSAMTFNNTAKSGNVLSSNITRKNAEMENSNGKQPLFQLLNIMLIIYIRYCCSIHPSESVTVYLGKQILLLPATGLWHLFPQHMVLCAAITDIGPKGHFLCEMEALRGCAQKRWFLAWQILLQAFLCRIFLRWSVITVFTPNEFEYTQIFFFPTMKATVCFYLLSWCQVLLGCSFSGWMPSLCQFFPLNFMQI